MKQRYFDKFSWVLIICKALALLEALRNSYFTTKVSAPKEFKIEVLSLTLGKASPFEERSYKHQQEANSEGEKCSQESVSLIFFF